MPQEAPGGHAKPEEAPGGPGKLQDGLKPRFVDVVCVPVLLEARKYLVPRLTPSLSRSARDLRSRVMSLGRRAASEPAALGSEEVSSAAPLNPSSRVPPACPLAFGGSGFREPAGASEPAALGSEEVLSVAPLNLGGCSLRARSHLVAVGSAGPQGTVSSRLLEARKSTEALPDSPWHSPTLQRARARWRIIGS